MAKGDCIEYSDGIGRISRVRDDGISNEDTVVDSKILLQEKLYEELRIAVIKHRQYLHELEAMPYVAPPKLYMLTKRIMDVSVGILGLIFLSPLLLVVALLIKLDSKGPVLYKQIRVGKDGKEFFIYKFRTMVKDAEDKTGPVWTPTGNDPRCTNMGSFLRKSHIDEFAQFLNLVKGDMSLVGPRPERPHFVYPFAKLIPGYCCRMNVLPGITGPAQLRNGYDRTGMDIIRKLRADATYLKKMGLSMDIGLLFETFISVFKREL